MSDESGFSTRQRAGGNTCDTSLLGSGFGKLSEFTEKREALRAALRDLGEIHDEKARKNIKRLQRQLETLEPSITMIGQVKAGKTSLVNAMVGWPDLLPADVNPWTSVVTSLHVNPGVPRTPVRARFKFFDQEEWSRLLDKGGRVGELASRAGADDELAKIRQQVEHMREKSRNRLGRQFEMLMGQQHEYSEFNEEIVERYVCLGDDFGDELPENPKQGRFADITKSADLYFQRSELPLPLCIRDTPGVNDTFMMREQITIKAIRDSRLCVVVLSAHQALSSVDMAMIRLISNINAREVIIFVNRIDELSDPSRQVPEIRESIRETLRKHDGPVDAEIVFGSAYWANNALLGRLECLDDGSADALMNWAEEELAHNDNTLDLDSPRALVWQLSGLPTLFDALAERISSGAGKEAIERIARSTNNLATSLQMAGHIRPIPAEGTGEMAMDRAAIAAEIDRIGAKITENLRAEFGGLVQSFQSRLDNSHRSFVDRATASLVSHLERYGENEVWTYDPAGLRLLMRSAYRVFNARATRAAIKAYDAAAAELGDLYSRAFGFPEPIRVEAPIAGHIPPAVTIGQTIALDVRGNWWKNWWHRKRGYQAFASSFFAMIVAETDPIVTDLKTTQVDLASQEIFSMLENFLAEQKTLMTDLADTQANGGRGIEDLFGNGLGSERFQEIKSTVGALMVEAA